MTHQITRIGSMKFGMFGDVLLDIAFILAEEAQRAIKRGGYKVIPKDSYGGKPSGDIALSIDLDIQALFVQLVTRRLPAGIGLFGEEGKLRRPSTLPGPKVVVTVDPVDGTKLLEQTLREGRMPQPGEISVMLGIMIDGIAVGGIICDIVTLEACIRFPYGEDVWRIIGPSGLWERVSSLPSMAFREGTLLQHGSRSVGSPLAERLIASAFGGAGQIARPHGSIGLCASRVLSDNRVVALIRPTGTHNTAWDDASIAAFSATDLLTLMITDKTFEETRVPLDEPTKHPLDLLYISRRHLDDLGEFGTVQLLS